MWEQIKNTFRRNKLQKLVALISSITLWFYVMESQNPVINGSYDVPITMRNTPEKFKANYREETIRIKLSAPRSYFIDYTPSNIRASANLQNYSAEGEYEIPIDAIFPKGFELESITPSTINVQLDPLIEKQMVADVIVTGTPVADSIVSKLAKSSENITLMGSKTEVNRVKRVIGFIGLNGNNETFDIIVPMTAIDEDGRKVESVRIAPSAITVTVQIESELRKKEVPIIADIDIPHGREISEIVINPQTVEITGREDVLNTVELIKTEPLAFVVNARTFIGKLRLILPEGVNANKTEVDVTCKFKE